VGHWSDHGAIHWQTQWSDQWLLSDRNGIWERFCHIIQNFVKYCVLEKTSGFLSCVLIPTCIRKSNWTPKKLRVKDRISPSWVKIVFWVSLQLFGVIIVVQAHQIYRSYFEMHPSQLMQLVWSNLQKLFWNASIANSCNWSDQIYRSYILKCIHCNSCNSSDQINRSYFEMHPLQLVQLVWSNLQKLFWNASIATHATCLIKFTEVILKCISCNSCNWSDQIYKRYFEMHPLQLMQLVWSNLQKLFWNASLATHATRLIKFTEVILKCIHCNWCNSSDQIYRSYFEMHRLQLSCNCTWSQKKRPVSFWKKHYTRTCRMKAQSISFLKIKEAVVELWSTLASTWKQISRFTRFVTWTHDQF
jgi:hypothetical protein